jgi:two-component system, NarL family, nitrate/nitrite response regulator NarL
METSPPRVLIIDDNLLFAEAIQSALERDGIQVVVAGSSAEGRVALRKRQPDLVLLDIGLPDELGERLGREILAEHPGVKVVVVTALTDAQARRCSMEEGFHGFLTKDMPLVTFVASVRTILDGGTLPAKPLAGLARRSDSPEHQQVMLLARQLTAREREMLALLAAGVDGGEIARRLGISPHTVRTHIKSILAKLQVHSRLEAVAFSVRHGIVSVDGKRRYA